MPRSLRIVLAVVVGFVAGSVVNMALVSLGGKIIPPPSGADVSTMEGLRAALPLFKPQHYLFPFLAHAFGTLAGAFLACWLTPGRPALPAYIVGCLFLLGGLANAALLPAPMWFIALDLLLAYLPAAWLGKALAQGMRGGSVPGGT